MISHASLRRLTAYLQLALLASAMVLPIATRGACPHGQGGVMDTAMLAGHHQVSPDAPGTGEQSRDAECRCLGDCCAGRVPLGPSPITSPQPVESIVPVPAPAIQLTCPATALHLNLLPFATAPPLV